MITVTTKESRKPLPDVGSCYTFDVNVVMIMLIDSQFRLIVMSQGDYFGKLWTAKVFDTAQDAHNYITSPENGYKPFYGDIIITIK